MVVWPLVLVSSVTSGEYAREEEKWCLADTNLCDESQCEHLCDLADVEERNWVNLCV